MTYGDEQSTLHNYMEKTSEKIATPQLIIIALALVGAYLVYRHYSPTPGFLHESF